MDVVLCTPWTRAVVISSASALGALSALRIPVRTSRGGIRFVCPAFVRRAVVHGAAWFTSRETGERLFAPLGDPLLACQKMLLAGLAVFGNVNLPVFAAWCATAEEARAEIRNGERWTMDYAMWAKEVSGTHQWWAVYGMKIEKEPDLELCGALKPGVLVPLPGGVTVTVPEEGVQRLKDAGIPIIRRKDMQRVVPREFVTDCILSARRKFAHSGHVREKKQSIFGSRKRRAEEQLPLPAE